MMGDAQFEDEQELALLIGLIAMHWNQLHHAVCLCFPIALGGAEQISGPVLDAIKSDDTQRKVVQAVVLSALKGAQHNKQRSYAKDLFNRIGRLAGQRNGFLHSAWTQESDGPIIPSFAHRKPHGGVNSSAVRKQAVEFVQEIKAARMEVLQLWDYLQRAASP